MSLLTDLAAAEAGSSLFVGCRACAQVQQAENAEEKLALSRALASTIGAERLSAILAGHGISISVRQIYKHRREGHSA